MLPLLFCAVAFAAVPSVESILNRMASSTPPDTSEYRSVTSVRIGEVTTRVSMHVIECGKSLRWMELDAGGRQSRIVTNGGRSLLTDLETNTTMAMPAPEGEGDRIVAMKNLAASRWSEPRALEGSLWRLKQLDIEEAGILSRSMVWDEAAGEARSLEQIGRKGDTTRIDFTWMRTGGYTVPEKTSIVVTVPGRTVRTETTFADWRFPRSIPSSLFAIP